MGRTSMKCSVCKEDGCDFETRCGHFFHKLCLNIRNIILYIDCPACGKRITSSKLIESYLKTEDYSNITSMTDNDKKELFYFSVCENDLGLFDILKDDVEVCSRADGFDFPIIAACLNDNLEMFDKLVNMGADVNCSDSDSWTPLIYASVYGYVELFERLVKLGADINCKDSFERSPLIIAYDCQLISIDDRNNCTLIFNRLLDLGADLNLVDNFGESILYYALEKDDLEVFKKLISLGINIESCDDYGYNILHYAVKLGKIDFIIFLIDSGRFDVETPICDEWGYTPLCIAVKNHHVEAVRLLIKRGAYVNYRIYESSHTPLHLACQVNDVEIVKILLENGADLEALDCFGCTPLHMTCEYDCLEIFELLMLESKAHLNSNTWLHLAAKNGSIDVITKLLKLGVDPNEKTLGKTPLHFAARYGHFKVFKVLVDFGADISLKNGQRKTPLDLARENGHVDIYNKYYKKNLFDKIVGIFCSCTK